MLKSRDKVSVVGEILSTAFTASVGAFSVGTIASLAGPSTI